MKKLNRKFIKGTNWALAGIMSAIGFSSCNVIHGPMEYGTPHADYKVSGKVTDSNGNRLQGIRVTIPEVNHDQRNDGFIPDEPIITHAVNDTLYTKENGIFEYIYYGFPTKAVTVKMKFEDISEIARYETDSTAVTFSRSELKGGDKHWYSGKANKEVTIQLKDR